MLMIILTGNFGFFNLLTVTLCLFSLNDSMLGGGVGTGAGADAGVYGGGGGIGMDAGGMGVEVKQDLLSYLLSLIPSLSLASSSSFLSPFVSPFLSPFLSLPLSLLLFTGHLALNVLGLCAHTLQTMAVLAFIASLTLANLFPLLCLARGAILPRKWLDTLHSCMRPLRVCNTYGLFARMRAQQYQVELQGSSDGGRTWKTYGFRYKPGCEGALSGMSECE